MTSSLDLFLPEEYRTNPQASADRDGTPYWGGGLDHNDVRYQVPVYRLAAKLAKTISPQMVMDIGCGSGDKLHEFFGEGGSTVVGVDQESAIRLANDRYSRIEWLPGDLDSEEFWEMLTTYKPDLVICSDVIEHLVDPVGLLRRLHGLVGNGLLVLSTPDRARLDSDQLGPPKNPRHIREWTAEELSLLLTTHGFKIFARHHLLPRRYTPTVVEVRRLVGRLRRGMAVPDRRTCQAYVLRRD